MSNVHVYYIWIACFCRIILGVSSERWLDPTNPHSFEPDYPTRMRGQAAKWLDPTNPHSFEPEILPSNSPTIGTQCDMTAFYECEKKLENTKLLKGLLQRQTSLLLQAANLFDAASDNNYVRPIVLTLTSEQLRQLQNFAKNGVFDTGTLDMTWSSMLSRGYESKWNWKWPSFSISKETMIVTLEIGSVLAIALMIALRTPLKRIVGITFLLGVIVSVVLRAHRTFQAAEARQRHMLFNASQMPAVCRPGSDQTWKEWVALFFTRQGDVKIITSQDIVARSVKWCSKLPYHFYVDAEQDALCSKFYEKGYSDPMTHVTPLELGFNLILDIMQTFSSRTGTSLKEFCDAVFADVPYPLNVVICSVAKLGSLILLILFCVLTVWFCLTRRKSVHVVHQAPQSIQPAQPAAQYHIVNHGHLVLGSSEMQVLQPGNVQTTTTKQFLRAQSEGSIRLQEQPDRPRSMSTSGAILAPEFKEPEPGRSETMEVFSEEEEFSEFKNFSENNQNEPPANVHQKETTLNSPKQDSSGSKISLDPQVEDLISFGSPMPLCSNESGVGNTSSHDSMFDSSMDLTTSEVSLSPMVSQLSVFLDSLQIEESLTLDLSSDAAQTKNNKSLSEQVKTPMEEVLSTFEIVEKTE